MEKSKHFEKELNYIQEERLRQGARSCLDELPDYFFEVPASSTGKYHPKYALGEQGLLRHSKAAVRIGYELLQDELIRHKYTEKEIDLMLIALMIHDGLKHGLTKDKFVRFDHPIIMANYLNENGERFGFQKEEVDFLKEVISSHMGSWNTNPYSDVVLPIPKTKCQNFVHMCDYLASRKCILLSFDEENNIVD